MTKKKPQIILLSIAGLLLLFSFGLYISRQMGHLKLDKQITQLRKVTILTHALSDGNDYYFSVLVSLYPKEKKAALFFINPLSQFETETASLEKLKSGAIKTVEKELSKTLGFSPNYSITVKEDSFKRIVDLIGGLPIYFDPKTTLSSDRYNRPLGGSYYLDGEDAFDYLTYLPSKKGLEYVYRLEKQESAILTFYSQVFKNKDSIKKQLLSYIFTLLNTNLEESEFATLLDFLSNEEIYFGISELPGELQAVPKTDEFVLKISSDTAKVAYKKFEADVLSEFFADTERTRTEVLNGTEVNGLAKRAKSTLNERRIKVLTVENAWNSNFKETIILDRSGNTKVSTKVSEALGSQNLFYVIRKELGLDVTIVLGEDFDKSK